MEKLRELFNNLNLDPKVVARLTYKDELKSLIKEIKEELDDEDYSSEECETSDDELEKECVEETLKVNVDEKDFMSLDLDFKKSNTNKDECK